MEVHLTPELEKKLNDLAEQTGRAADELVEDAMTGYLDELAGLRGRLDRRYDDLKSGRVKPIDGDEALAASGRKGFQNLCDSQGSGCSVSVARASRPQRRPPVAVP